MCALQKIQACRFVVYFLIAGHIHVHQHTYYNVHVHVLLQVHSTY